MQWMTHHIIPMHVLAELVVHSYPYKADIHMTLQVSLECASLHVTQDQPANTWGTAKAQLTAGLVA
jgi:hypothetical protein